MPATPLPTAEQIETLRTVLLERRHALEQVVHSETSAVTDRDSDALPDPHEQSSDAASAIALIEQNSVLRQKHVTELAAIDAALARIESDNYGICIDCGEPIGSQRLSAQPTALRCIGCQTRREHPELGSHTPRL